MLVAPGCCQGSADLNSDSPDSRSPVSIQTAPLTYLSYPSVIEGLGEEGALDPASRTALECWTDPAVLWVASCGQCPVGGVLWVASCGQCPVGGVLWVVSCGQCPVGSVLWAASCGQCPVGSAYVINNNNH
ncbi:hypothetical protein NFI96_001194 [Prochilodus magdalenae]|nr:hypothetical protein NFI96_001194 [Prochilodus magdalenae]